MISRRATRASRRPAWFRPETRRVAARATAGPIFKERSRDRHFPSERIGKKFDGVWAEPKIEGTRSGSQGSVLRSANATSISNQDESHDRKTEIPVGRHRSPPARGRGGLSPRSARW